MYKIEHDVPPPSASSRKGSTYPFKDMNCGDSFFVPQSGPNYDALRQAAIRFSKNNPEYAFSLRKVKGGYRVWRVEKKVNNDIV